MAKKRRKAEEIIRLLKQSDVLISQGRSISEVCRELELENKRLRRAVSDLTLDNQVLKDVAEGNL